MAPASAALKTPQALFDLTCANYSGGNAFSCLDDQNSNASEPQPFLRPMGGLRMPPKDTAVELVATPRRDLLAFRLRGQITEDAVETMADAMTAAFKEFDEVDVLIILCQFEGVSGSAVFDADALGAQAQSIFNIRRYAVVGAPDWAERMIDTLKFFSPVDARTFSPDEEAKAWRWIDGRESE